MCAAALVMAVPILLSGHKNSLYLYPLADSAMYYIGFRLGCLVTRYANLEIL
jgi:hypothetical protein